MTAETPSFKREMLATLPSLRAFAVSLTGRHDKADDLVQDTMMTQRILQPDAQARA
jgi:RNA polymerase sigma-70 factor (ECF subfamily)